MAAERTRSARRVWLLCLVSSALAAALSGCSGVDDGRTSGDTLTIQVGVVPIVDVAPLYLGREKGFFAEEKLNVEPRVTAGGNLIPSVVSGDLQLGWVNATSVVIARSKGLPLRMLPRGTRGGLRPEESGAAILAKGDGPVSEAKDLEGRTVGVAALQSVSTLTASASPTPRSPTACSSPRQRSRPTSRTSSPSWERPPGPSLPPRRPAEASRQAPCPDGLPAI